MADQTELPETQPPSPAPENPLPAGATQNEPIGIPSDAAPSGRLEKIRALAAKVGAKFKAGRGRPRKDGLPKANDVVVTTTGETVPATERPALAAVAQLDAPSPSQARLHKNIAKAGKAVIGGGVDALRWYNGADGFKPEFLNPLLERARPDDELLSDWTEDTQALLAKYSVNIEHAEEANWLLSSSRIAAGFFLVLREIRLEKIRRQLEAKGGKA